MRLLRKFLDNLDDVAALAGLVVLIGAAFIVHLRGLPDIYLIAILIGTICVAVYFVFGSKLEITNLQPFNKEWQTWVCLGAICVIGLSQLWYVNLKFPNSLIGLDPWTHIRIVTQELDVALSPFPNTYGINHLDITTIGGYFSLMHLYLRSIMEITGLDYKWVSLVFWGSLQAVGTVILVYLIGKELVGKGVGLLAAFLVSIASWVVMFNEWNVPNSSGAILCLVAAYLVIKAYTSKMAWVLWLAVIPLALAILTHILVAAWVVGTILCLSLLLIGKAKIYYLVPIVAVLLFAGWYNFISINLSPRQMDNVMQAVPSLGQSTPLLAEAQQQSVPSAVAPASDGTTEVVVAADNYNISTFQDVLNNGSLGELVVDSIGMFLYVGVAIIGVLVMLKSAGANRAWAILCIGTLLMGFILPLCGFTILKERWWYLAESFMSIPLAVALVGVLKTK